MASENLLLIFAKNPVLGTAKTRLAQSVGDEKALEIYTFLLQYTAHIAAKASGDKRVCYTSHVDNHDMFPSAIFDKTLQDQGDLGERMLAAFKAAFEEGYKQVIIIGSDCYELTTPLINQAITALTQHDFVIGPAKDGGYYLLGMRQLEGAVFRNKKWSQARLYQDTLNDLEALGYSYFELPILSDIDFVEDLPPAIRSSFDV